MKNCANCSAKFEIPQIDQRFYERIDVPAPTWCMRCRHLRRHAFINDYAFFQRACDHCRKQFVSIYPAETDYTVYCQKCWYAEERDDKESRRDYDANRSFFEQFNELMYAAPLLGIIGQNNQNCDYCESIANCRNCYLISECSNCEDCYYSYWIQKSTDCFDSNYAHECEKCYEVDSCFQCTHLKYSQNCTG